MGLRDGNARGAGARRPEDKFHQKLNIAFFRLVLCLQKSGKIQTMIS